MVQRSRIPLTTKAVGSNTWTGPDDALLDDAEADEVAVTDPEPGAAVPVDVPPAFWEPGPKRPTPLPAPVVMYYFTSAQFTETLKRPTAAAAGGMAGRASDVTFQVGDFGGHALAPPVELYPPSPDGLTIFLNAV